MEVDREDNNKDYSIKHFSLSDDITFNHVTFFLWFSTPGYQKHWFENKKGEKIAFVGESGAGKSTIVRLLLRFIEPSEGYIRIGHQDLSDLDYGALRKKVSYIPQFVELFSGTIIDNLKIGNPEATYEDMTRVCRLVGIHNTIQNFRNRYGSFVEEGGQNFSGVKSNAWLLRELCLVGYRTLYFWWSDFQPRFLQWTSYSRFNFLIKSLIKQR